MPIKQVTCDTCKQLVNKAVTYFVGDGKRACKSHEGVEAKKEELTAQAEAKRKQASRPNNKPINASFGDPIDQPPQDFRKPRCWVCDTPGLRSTEFYQKALVEMEKAKIVYGNYSLFDRDHPANKGGLMKEECIYIVDKEAGKAAIPYIMRKLGQIVQMAGFVALCSKCVRRFKVDTMPKVDLEVLVNLSMAYDVFGKPMVQEIAKDELKRDN